jgi:O-methyltransferase involved in polyketide biosynthesis
LRWRVGGRTIPYRPPDWARLARQPDTAVVIVGAGFDARAFRLPGGRWVELDEPALITLKEAQLPAREALNPLTRVAIRFEHESLEATLAPFRHLSDPVVVLEGILPYLSAAEVRLLLQAIRNSFSRPTLVCDLTTPAFARRYAGKIGKRFRELGAPYGRLEVDPLELIRAAGFRLTTRQSAVGHAGALGLLWIPRWLLATLPRSLRDGYTIASFEPGR